MELSLILRGLSEPEPTPKPPGAEPLKVPKLTLRCAFSSAENPSLCPAYADVCAHALLWCGKRRAFIGCRAVCGSAHSRQTESKQPCLVLEVRRVTSCSVSCWGEAPGVARVESGRNSGSHEAASERFGPWARQLLPLRASPRRCSYAS